MSNLTNLLDMLGARRRIAPETVLLHPGDVQWQFARLRVPEADVRMSEDEAGFAIADSATGDVLWMGAEALEWAVDHLRAGGVETAEVAVPEDDNETTRALQKLGFVQSELHFIELRRDLQPPLPALAPPAGFRMETLATAGSAEAFVELHRDAWSRWGPSSYSVEVHRRLEAMPGYDPALVPVAVAPDGRLASTCICWLDPATLVGEIEPLGTGRAFGRLGLARAVVLEASRLMRDRGMRTAYVSGSSVNAPAMSLYASAGFRPGRRSHTWTLSLRS